MAVVVVESPAKAKTINKYLGDEFIVLASVGHVRDLIRKNGAVDPKNDFAMNWEVANDKQKNIKAIADALSSEKKLILATDPDREGEAISWHLLEVLNKRRAIKKSTEIERVVFNAITKSSVLDEMKKPRKLDMPLIEAYLARRALDHLVGFNLSPVLWTKLPGARSAGRVQSVSLKLIVDREMQIESFNSQEYWSVKVSFKTEKQEDLEGRLTFCNGKKIEKMTLTSEKEASEVCQQIKENKFSINNISSSPIKRNPAAPFMTSTLQQEASRKLGLGAKETMITAQRLYENGLITYMRTDGIDMSSEAVSAVRTLIEELHSPDYLPQKPRIYKNSAKNAQEAHECIRPTDLRKIPGKMETLEKVQENLYKLIWNRTVASQMESARFQSTTIEIASLNKNIILKTSGQVLLFDGFLKVYVEGDDDKKTDPEIALPPTEENQKLMISSVNPEQHFTQPPPRYSEATLVKKMEELGIGRPSTYASILSTIQDREYVKKDKNRLVPEDKGRLVTVFLNSYFNKYLQYDYTANLEKKLDKISNGDADWKQILKDFWNEFERAIDKTSDLRITEVLEKLNEVLGPHIFPEKEDGTNPRLCTSCNGGTLSMRTSRSGSAFIGCSNYPDCKYTRPLNPDHKNQDTDNAKDQIIGISEDGQKVQVKSGRFGPYLQLGEQSDPKIKPPRTSIPKGMPVDSIDLKKAMQLLNLPREIGPHPEDGVIISAAIGPYGPYVKHGRTYANLADPEEVLIIGMNRAVQVLKEKLEKGAKFNSAKILRTLGNHPNSGPIELMNGKYGPYVRWQKINATLPKNLPIEEISLEQATELVNEKASQKKTTRNKGRMKTKAISGK